MAANSENGPSSSPLIPDEREEEPGLDSKATDPSTMPTIPNPFLMPDFDDEEGLSGYVGSLLQQLKEPFSIYTGQPIHGYYTYSTAADMNTYEYEPVAADKNTYKPSAAADKYVNEPSAASQPDDEADMITSQPAIDKNTSQPADANMTTSQPDDGNMITSQPADGNMSNSQPADASVNNSQPEEADMNTSQPEDDDMNTSQPPAASLTSPPSATNVSLTASRLGGKRSSGEGMTAVKDLQLSSSDDSDSDSSSSSSAKSAKFLKTAEDVKKKYREEAEEKRRRIPQLIAALPQTKARKKKAESSEEEEVEDDGLKERVSRVGDPSTLPVITVPMKPPHLHLRCMGMDRSNR